MPTSLNRIKLWSVGGGKGGIGKSLVTLGLGVALARLGKKIILIDGDLGGANLHTLMGVRYPHVTLEHFLTKKVARLEDTMIETAVEGISLICGADDLMGAANPTFSQKIRLLQQIEALPALDKHPRVPAVAAIHQPGQDEAPQPRQGELSEDVELRARGLNK